MDSPYDEWSRHVHAVITFFKPFFSDWRSYVSLVSALLGVGILIMENQVLLRMRVGLWEIAFYILWCLISAFLGPIFDIVVMVGLFIYFRRKSNRLHLTNESIAKALLPAPKARNYRAVGAVCILASGLTLCSNILYMLRGWKEPTHLFDLATTIIRWMTTQLWYVLGMTLLFHVVTRPAQSGVVLFGKFPRDLWTNKWYLCILYIPVHYMLLELCDIHRDTIQILIPLEIIVDVLLYNGPFLIVLLRLIYLSWKVAYDEAVLTGAVFEEDEDGHGPMDGGSSNVRRGQTAVRPGSSGYVGLAMVDLDEAERGERHSGSDHDDGHLDSPSTKSGAPIGRNAGMSPEAAPTNAFVLEEEDDIGAISSLKPSPAVSPKPPPPPKSKKTVMFDVDSPKVATIELEDEDHHLLDRGVDQHDQPLLQSSGDDRHEEEGPRV